MSGRSKPPSVHCGIQLSTEPGQIPGYLYALFRFAPAGIRRFIGDVRLRSAGMHHNSGHSVSFLVHSRDSHHPCHAGLRTRLVGGLSSATKNRYRRPHSPSHILINIEREKEYVKNTAWESNSIRLRDGYCPINRHLFIEIS